MKKRWLLLCITILLCSNNLLSQARASKTLQFLPYAGLSSPQGDFKKLSDNGSIFGLSIDKYLSPKFALGLDINYQINAFKNEIDYSIIPSPSVVKTIENGSWSNATLTFGPTYSFGNQKFNTEIYTKAGVSFVKSPSATTTISHPAFADFDIFDLKEQQVTSFGLTSGIRFNYSINEKLSFFINPQYVISGAEINYYFKDPTVAYIPGTDGADPIFEPGILLEFPGREALVKPSYFNLNFGVKIDLGKSKGTTTNVNRNIPICDISLAEVQCDASGATLKLMKFWNNFDPFFTTTVEVFNGTTLINPNSSAPQSLSQNYGNIPFYTPINNNLIGVTLTAVIKIFDTNGILKCESTKTFTVPPCSPQPPSCSFDLDFSNVTCDSNFITYNATSTWANITVGSTIEIVANEHPSGTSIPLTVSPNLPYTISTTSGTVSHTVSLPYSYNGMQISLTMKITDPTTGYIKNCGFADFFTPICEPESTLCDWEYTITCDSKNKGIKINVTSTWSNAPAGSLLNYSLIDQSTGLPIPFTFSPNNLPQPIVSNGSSSHTLYINSSYSNTPVVFKMLIDDGHGVLICNKGKDFILPSCVFKTCELIENEASCNNENPFMAFSVDWSNYTNFSNYSIYLDALDENGNPVAWFNFPPFPLTGPSGSAPFNMNLLSQYAGTTIIIRSRICETASNGVKSCCDSELKIKIPKCCEICSGINDINDTTDVNQTNIIDFVITGVITQSNPIPISKVVAQLEAIKFKPLNNNPLTISNFEFTRSWFANGGPQSTITTGVVGSVIGNRSNLIITEINPASATNMIFRLNVDNYNYGRNLSVEFYKVKLTIFKDDGSYCEKFIIYQR